MPVDLPPTDAALGNEVLVLLTTPPLAASGIPTVTEINAGLFATCHIYGRFNATPNQNSGEGPRKWCSKNTPTRLGTSTYPIIEVQYSYKPQELGTPGAAGNEVYEALEPDAVLTAVLLAGIDGKSNSVAAGDVCDVLLVRAGKRRKGVTGEGEFDELSTSQMVEVVNGEAVAEDHVIAA